MGHAKRKLEHAWFYRALQEQEAGMMWRYQSGCLLPADAEAREFVGKLRHSEVVDMGDAKRTKTPTQRNAEHLWLRQLADMLNDAGYDMVLFLETLDAEDTTVPCTMESLKERFWKVILKHMKNKDSTEDETTVDPNELYQAACRIISEKFGLVPPPWPSRHGYPA